MPTVLRFIEPCLPSPADRPPSGSNWIHEIKHDGYRLMARRDSVGIRLITRRGNDWSDRFPLVIEAVNHLKVRSCLIDGEVCAVTSRERPVRFLRQRRNEAASVLVRLRPAGAGRRGPEAGADRGPQGNAGQHLAEEPSRGAPERAPGARLRVDGFPARLPLGCEGIVSKRIGSRYRSGRSADWLKFKNPGAPAVKREAEEDGAGTIVWRHASKAASHSRPGHAHQPSQAL